MGLCTWARTCASWPPRTLEARLSCPLVAEPAEGSEVQPTGDLTRSLAVSRVDGAPAESQPVELAAGELVGRYRVRRAVGEGGMGRVYLARDESLGRSVALKIVLPEQVRARDLQRFIQEARTTAKLNHPHIVVLYDAGEHRGVPYLALEYVDGQSLKQRMDREVLSVDEVLRVGRSIADALTHAHASGVKHCDLKPSNVMLPTDGRLRVVDFGLAVSELTGSNAAAGTPEWMAPEQWRGEAISDRVDCWALGVMLYQLLSQQHPFGPASTREQRRTSVTERQHEPPRLERDELPVLVADAIQRALNATPEARPSAIELYKVLDDALRGAGAKLEGSPYRGLAAFSEEHAALFFARDPEIEQFLERLRGSPILPIVGPSGAGKSSFLHAGVIPRLKARAHWTILTMRPGSRPFDELAACLVAAGGGAGSGQKAEVARLAADLRDTPTLLALRLSTIATSRGGQALLAVDQLEELFTHVEADADVQRFLELLWSAADDPSEPVRVVVTLRDDFLGRIPAFRQLFVLRKLTPELLRQAIVGPVARFGYRFEDPALVDEILAEVGDVSAGLPLLQFACSSLWDARDREHNLLLRSAYERLGGVAGALARHADGVLAELTEDEQRAARALLTRLVAGTSTRKVVERSMLLADLPDGAPAVLDRLLAGRLLVQRRPQGEGKVLVELAHESLVQSWDQLARWLDESREERRLLHELEEASSPWARRGRRAAETWSAEDIASARRRSKALGMALPDAAEEFLAAGELRDKLARRRTRLQRIAGVGIGLTITAGSIVAALAYRDQKLAAEERAESLKLAAGNLGEVEIVLQPFDSVADTRAHALLTELPNLTWTLFSVAADDPHREGEPIPIELVRLIKTERGEHELIVRSQVPGGAAFLRIDGRGRVGESCAPSWVRIGALPGYAQRGNATRLEIPVPTCRASRDGMVEIPAGEFIYGGPGEPPTRFAEYVEAERVVTVDTFWIDRTEVSNAAFAPFQELTTITGYAAVRYPSEGLLKNASDGFMPVTAVDAFEAQAYCRYMGKHLPGDYQWTKAARGGLTIDGALNRAPRRLFPSPASATCVNAQGPADGFDAPAPVAQLKCGASPYGVLNLAGNVSEWISKEGQVEGSLRIIRGGDWNSPTDLEHTTTVFRNTREPRFFSFDIGVRCATDGADQGA